jgi:exodeoxyribonuclease VIII
MRMGTLVHTAILEPDTLGDRTVVAPVVDRRTNAGKAAWAEFEASIGDRELITADEIEKLKGITEAAWAHPATGKALSMIRDVEASIFWTDPATGVDCRCRPDAILSNGTILDVKTTKDARPSEFARSIANFRYHVQAAFYSDGYTAAFGEPPRAFVFLAIETEPPFLTALYVLDPKAIIRGRAEYERDLETYRVCRNTGEWPGLADQPLVIDLPKWA